MAHAKIAKLVSLPADGLANVLTPQRLASQIRAAARLVLGVLDEVRQLRPSGTTAEVSRRDLEIETRSLVHLVGELAQRMIDLRVPLPEGSCPHCGWSYSLVTPRGTCPRCERLREVRRDSAAHGASSLRAHPILSALAKAAARR